MAVNCTATTQKRHWKMSSIVSEWKLKLLRASLFSSTMLADATQYARPANICEREGVIAALVRAELLLCQTPQFGCKISNYYEVVPEAMAVADDIKRYNAKNLSVSCYC